MSEQDKNKNNLDPKNAVLEITGENFQKIIETITNQTKESLQDVAEELRAKSQQDLMSTHSLLIDYINDQHADTKKEIEALIKTHSEEEQRLTHQAEIREKLGRFAPVVAPVHWVQNNVKKQTLKGLFISAAFLASVAAIQNVMIPYYGNKIMEQSNKTEFGQIKAKHPQYAINGAKYTQETGAGPYVLVTNALSEGLRDAGYPNYGIDRPGGSEINYLKTAPAENKYHISLVEPNVAAHLAAQYPDVANNIAHIGNIEIRECAWSASPKYKEYSALLADLEAGKTITIGAPQAGTGHKYATDIITAPLKERFNDQISYVHLSDTADMTALLKSGAIDLAIFTEAAGTFDGKLSGSVSNISQTALVNFVSMDDAYSQTLGAAYNKVSALQLPTMQSVSLPCNDTIGLYGHKANNGTIDALELGNLHQAARDINVVKGTLYAPFPLVKK